MTSSDKSFIITTAVTSSALPSSRYTRSLVGAVAPCLEPEGTTTPPDILTGKFGTSVLL